jgi:hypothetical protein
MTLCLISISRRLELIPMSGFDCAFEDELRPAEHLPVYRAEHFSVGRRRDSDQKAA